MPDTLPAAWDVATQQYWEAMRVAACTAWPYLSEGFAALVPCHMTVSYTHLTLPTKA